MSHCNGMFSVPITEYLGSHHQLALIGELNVIAPNFAINGKDILYKKGGNHSSCNP